MARSPSSGTLPRKRLGKMSQQQQQQQQPRRWTVCHIQGVMCLIGSTYLVAMGYFLISWVSYSSSTSASKSESSSSSQTNSLDMDVLSSAKTNKHKNVKLVGRVSNDNAAKQPLSLSEKEYHQQSSSNWDPFFHFDKSTAERALSQHGPLALRKPITAYLEPPLNDMVPNTGSRGDLNNDHDAGTPPEFVVPLPLRTHTPNDLQKVVYPRVQTCEDMPGKFPVDRGLELDEMGQPIVWNVGDVETPDDFAQQEVPYCPVEADPFLPWIHDVFPTQDGTTIRFVAQNRRLCRTGQKFTKDLERLVPQVALLQSVSVQRINETVARALAPSLWQNNDHAGDAAAPRYRLAPHAEASDDGMFTRFICRFHTTNFQTMQSVILGETLSVYPFNYEYIAYRKRHDKLLTPKGKDTKFFWTSSLSFECPVPENPPGLRQLLATGATILSDGTPSVHVDIIPMRTSTRYYEMYLTEEQIGPRDTWVGKFFDPVQRWGPQNVVPRVEASGRWTNIPICRPPALTMVEKEGDNDNDKQNSATTKLVPEIRQQNEKLGRKPHFLSACLWASTEFKTRGLSKGATSDTLNRLTEWIEFHLLIGFDHIYVYDNSGAHTNQSNLEPVLAQFPGRVTRFDWPSIICNNNIPAHDSTGERSSQYAAENSCRTRHAPFTEWIASFDTDEYFVPMGGYTSLRDVLNDAAAGGTNILSFRSSRGRLRLDKTYHDGIGRLPYDNATFLEAYNCDSGGIPKPSWGERARKQIYRADYVLYHHVHYSTVTQRSIQTYKEKDGHWHQYFSENPPSERLADELKEAVLVHAKTIKKDMTVHYETHCKYDYKKKWQGCWVGYPWPKGKIDTQEHHPDHDHNGHEAPHNADGFEYNCYINDRIDEYWVPRLRRLLASRNNRQQEVE